MTQVISSPTNHCCVTRCQASCCFPSPLFVSFQLGLTVFYCTCSSTIMPMRVFWAIISEPLLLLLFFWGLTALISTFDQPWGPMTAGDILFLFLLWTCALQCLLEGGSAWTFDLNESSTARDKTKGLSLSPPHVLLSPVEPSRLSEGILLDPLIG